MRGGARRQGPRQRHRTAGQHIGPGFGLWGWQKAMDHVKGAASGTRRVGHEEGTGFGDDCACGMAVGYGAHVVLRR